MKVVSEYQPEGAGMLRGAWSVQRERSGYATAVFMRTSTRAYTMLVKDAFQNCYCST